MSGASGQAVSHVFTSTGTFEVHVTATDKDGGISEVVSHADGDHERGRSRQRPGRRRNDG